MHAVAQLYTASNADEAFIALRSIYGNIVLISFTSQRNQQSYIGFDLQNWNF